ncbi:MAG: hypothetical protein OXU20_03100 [Myxococcales bacterium]|nr:hypothetical protein [Myxococcales bacterium]
MTTGDDGAQADGSEGGFEANLAPHERAYHAGDYRRARMLARGLLDTPDRQECERAQQLLRRMDPDRVQWGVLLACCALFIGVVIAYII